MAADPELAYNAKLHPHQAAMLCERGATDREIAEFFQVSPSTFYKWRNTHPEFCLAMQLGKEMPDDRVERSLYNRAVGYTYDSIKVMTRSIGDGCSEIVEVPIVEHIPPDVKAAVRWLEARRPKVWKRTLGISVREEDVDEGAFADLSEEERAQFRALVEKAAGGGPKPSEG